MQKTIDLSIIILSYNTPKILSECLTSIRDTEKSDYAIETIVVDNNSIDESVATIKKLFPWVSLIESKKNLGFAGGNNLAIPQSKGRYILFLNSDTVIPPNIFSLIIKYLDNNEKVGALTVKLKLASGEMDTDCHRGFPTPIASLSYFLGLEKLFPKSKIFGQYHKFYLPLDKIHEIDSACGAFLMVRKKALDQIGEWDQSYFFYGEDIDFCYRLREKGWTIIYYPEISVIHYKGVSSGLRSESRLISRADRETRIKASKASVEAMSIFYNKFYRNKYNPLLTSIILFGIKIKGLSRIMFNYLKK